MNLDATRLEGECHSRIKGGLKFEKVGEECKQENHMIQRIRRLRVLLVLPALATTGWAQDLSDEELRREIQELKARLSRLESVLDSRQTKEEPKPAVSATRAPEESSDPNSFKASWKNGLNLETADKQFTFQVGGRLQNDWAFFSADRELQPVIGTLQDGTEFRRARILLAAHLYGRLELKAEYDFAGGDAAFKDVFIAWDGVPGLGAVRFGHQKEPFSLEEITSSKYITFLERGLPNLFSPSRNTGVVIQNTAAGERVNWAAGVFREADDTGLGQAEGDFNFTARVTGLPWHQDGGGRLLHLGAAYSRQGAPTGLLRYRQRPEAHLATRFVDTGSFATESQDLLGLEAALVAGPFSLQSEYISAFVDRPPGAADPRFSGYYVQASFFPTGEHRVYKKSSAAFDRLRPKANFFDGRGGKGAWELAARFSHLDLEDSNIQGGELDDFTFGVNWYLNPNTRVMWNYVYSDRENTGDAHVFQTRFHIDF